MANTIEINGNLYRKENGTAKLTEPINPSKTYTEYSEQTVKVAASGGTESLNLGGVSYPMFLYAETDNAVEFKMFRGASAIGSTLPCNPALLITAGSGKRYGTVTIHNSSGDEAVVKVYIGG